jgi:hypothetical protein
MRFLFAVSLLRSLRSFAAILIPEYRGLEDGKTFHLSPFTFHRPPLREIFLQACVWAPLGRI